MAQWRCIKGCGACCHLDPSDRPDLEDYLTPAELQQYLTMIGDDGWCRHYDGEARECTIYETRPRFCRVQPDTFLEMYGIETEGFNDFAIDCCHQQISGVYGRKSEEIQRYRQEVG
ncbi:MAG: hypothetical protein N5P05_000463 [Chroococcopsis gigantea SAG 12.99]|nr:YkgJ family cysteine cluster protein [Chlorogloea purpurea SAG 13.99]MDV2998857.1 hypothetical protein [Chroococcopsis gigantea SAG 12.99]